MNRSSILASGLLVSLGCFLSACSGADGPGDQGNPSGLGGFYQGGPGGAAPFGNGGANGGGLTGGSLGGNNVGGNNVGGNNVGGNNVGGSNVGGVVGAGGAGGVGAGGIGAGGAPPATLPPCITNGATQGAIIGDSYVTGAFSPALQPELAKIQPTTGQFRNYAVAGTSMASGGIGVIPPQLDQALAASKTLKLVIMDGGGNDILLCNQGLYPGCNTSCNHAGSSTVKVCQDIAQGAFDAAKALMQKAADAGVKDVIYFYYPHTPSNNGGYVEILDYAEPKAKAFCDAAITSTSGKLACHWVSLVQAFKDAGGDKSALNFVADGIHPSAAGQTIIAKQISDRMTADHLGLASGNCTP